MDALDEDMPTLRKLEALQLYRCNFENVCSYYLSYNEYVAIVALKTFFCNILFLQELHLAPPGGNWIHRAQGGKLKRDIHQMIIKIKRYYVKVK